MSKEIVISTDSTVDLSDELIARFGIEVLPLYVEMDGKTYRDGIDVQPQALYDYYSRTGKLARSCAANVEDYAALFARLTGQGKAVVHINISSEMSSTHQNARIAAEQFEDVYVVDSRNLSTGIGLVVVHAAQMAEQGMPADEVARRAAELTPRVDASFVIDAIDYLRAGGRCSAVAAFGANLLKLKPSIQVLDGVMGVSKKYRGPLSVCQRRYIEDKLCDLEDIDPTWVFVTHSGMPQEMEDAAVQMVKQTGYFQQVHVTRAGCVISAHCGPQTMGVLFVRKTPLKK